MGQGGGDLTSRRGKSDIGNFGLATNLSFFSVTFLYFVFCPTRISFFLVGNKYLGVKKLNSPPGVNHMGPYTLKGKDGTVIDFMALTIIDPASSWFEIVELP
jgi:hypothetical protein